MSTTFGIAIPKQVLDENDYSNMNLSGVEESGNMYIVPIAFRSNGIRFINPIAHLLDDDIAVIPMHNSAQGIETIGDIKAKLSYLPTDR